MSHELIPATQMRYPGGKNGMWRASCTCGKYSSPSASPGKAERPILEHIKAKTDG